MPALPPLKTSTFSPVGWYVATYMHRFVVVGEDNERTDRKFHVWRNTALVKATTPEDAYRKAVALAKEGCKPYTNALGQKVRFVNEGLTSLIPVYEELKDGAELFWSSEDRKLSTIRRMARAKHQLEAFERERPAAAKKSRTPRRTPGEA
jgi:hypothetical protein